MPRPRRRRRTGGFDIDDQIAATESDPDTGADVTGAKGQIRGSSLLLVGRFVSIGLNFLTQVILVRSLSQSDYGAFAYVLSLVNLGEMIVMFGLDRGVGRFLAIYDEEGDQARLFGTLAMALGTILSLGLALILLVVGFREVIGGLIIDDPVALSLLVILILLSPIQALDQLFGSVLAVFASARSIFFRKYVLAPLLRLTVVGLLALGDRNVEFLAVGYVVAGALGVAVYAGILWRVIGDRGLRPYLRPGRFIMPVRTVLAFTFPLMTTDLVFTTMNTVDTIILGHYGGTDAVASFRVIQPLAGMNTVVFSAFTMLYMPAASRLFARSDRPGIADLYWRTAVWMAVLSFPVFAVTTSLAEPVTVALYGDRYADSATYLALLSFAAYVNVALGFNGLTLRVFGFVRYVVLLNLATAVANLLLLLVLVPALGALGAALATTTSMVLHNVLKQMGLGRGTGIRVFDLRYLRVYATIIIAAVVIAAVNAALRPHAIVGLAIAGAISFVVLVVNRPLLDVSKIFPEVQRLPIIGRLMGV